MLVFIVFENTFASFTLTFSKQKNFHSNSSGLSMCNKTLNIGFDVKVATVWLHDNWNYDIELKNFVKTDYYIGKPKRYDKGL